MNKFIRKNQKKFLAVFGVFLMISFAATTGSMSQRDRGDTAIGTLHDGKVTLTSGEFNTYLGEWQLLKRSYNQLALATVLGGVGSVDPTLVVKAMTDADAMDGVRRLVMMRQQSPEFYNYLARQAPPEQVAMANAAMGGSDTFGRLESNDTLFPILVKEAQALGVGVDADVVQGVLAARGITREGDPDLYETHQQALRSFLMVNNAADLSARVVKVSRPHRTNILASEHQRIALNLVEYPAKDFLDKVAPVTPDQLQKHFDKYKDVEATASPDGFGYKYPNRVKYEAVEIKKDEVKKAIGEVPLDQLYEYFLRNRGEFVASTQETFNITPGPTTRPMKFEEAKERILTKLTDQRVEELTGKIRDAVRNTMKADYDAFRAATGGRATAATTGATTAPAPASSLGVPYDSKDYLAKLRDKIQADFKVTITIEREEGLQTPQTLAESKLGKASFTAAESGLSFPQYMTMVLDPFLNDVQRKSLAGRVGGKPAAVWEPTPMFTNLTGDVLVARATVADPAHVPASLDEVKDKVAADVKQAGAYDLAKQAAQAAADAARSGNKWLGAVAVEQGKKVVTTGLFDAQSVMSGMPIAGYEFKGQSSRQFAQEAFKLLTLPARSGQATRPAATQATTRASAPATRPAAATAPTVAQLKDHPIGLIELKADGKVLLAEVDQIKPTWSKDTEALYYTGIGARNESDAGRLMRVLWMSHDHATKRVGYAPAEGREGKSREPEPEQRVPINPFTGTVIP
jgi:hypothetical protein